MPQPGQGSQLERDGLVRKVSAVAFVVWTPSPQTEVLHYSEVLRGSDEVLQEISETTPYEFTDADGRTKTGRRRVVSKRWTPEEIRRVFLPFVPEPLYAEADVEKLRTRGDMIVLTPRQAQEYRESPETAKRSKAFWEASAEVSKEAHGTKYVVKSEGGEP